MQRNRWSLEKIFSTPKNEHLSERSRPHKDIDKNSFYFIILNFNCLLPFLVLVLRILLERTANANYFK